jgi:hypothetical protein
MDFVNDEHKPICAQFGIEIRSTMAFGARMHSTSEGREAQRAGMGKFASVLDSEARIAKYTTPKEIQELRDPSHGTYLVKEGDTLTISLNEDDPVLLTIPQSGMVGGLAGTRTEEGIIHAIAVL